MKRFWSKVKKTKTCWYWIAGTRGNGYGSFSFKSRKVSAHRFSYELTNGPILNGLQVLHSCDTPSCVKPKHLYLGSKNENTLDMVSKNRFYSKLEPKDVKNIRSQYKKGNMTQNDLAKIYRVDQSTISNIVNKKDWRHL